MSQRVITFLALIVITLFGCRINIQGQIKVAGEPVAGLSCASESAPIPSYVRIISDPEDPEEVNLPDSLFYAIAGRTIFSVDKIALNTGSQLCTELVETVLPLARREGWKLEAIELRGSASPEGTYEHNKWLAEGRARALYRFMAQYLDPDATIATSIMTIPEDYPYLLWLLEQRGDGAAPVLSRIIDRYDGDPTAIKPAMKKVGDGAMWRRLVTDYYPYLRNARVMLFFSRTRPERHVETVAPLAMATPATIDPSGLTFNPFTGAFIERPHMLSLSSNLLYDIFYMPGFGWAPMLNINAEFYPLRGNFTFRAGFTSPYYHRWSRHEFFQIRDYHLEVRRYFNPGLLHTGAYLGAYINANKYGIGLNARKGWEGEGAGAAIKLGYVMPLGSGRWRLDFHIAAGGYYTKFDPYVWGNPVTGEEDGKYYYDYTGAISQFNRRSHRRWWIGPTEIGVTLSFDILYYRIAGGGASFRRKEVFIP